MFPMFSQSFENFPSNVSHALYRWAGCFLVLDLDPEKLNRTWALGAFGLWLFAFSVAFCTSRMSPFDKICSILGF